MRLSVLIGAAIVLWTSVTTAAPHPGSVWLFAGEIGDSPDEVEEKLRAYGAEVERFDFRAAGGLTNGLLAPPTMLALLNEFGTSKPLFEGLPDRGPSFVVGRGRDRAGEWFSVTFAFLDGGLWAVAAAFRVVGEGSRVENALDRSHLSSIRDSWDALSRRCRAFGVGGRDPYGNPRLLRGAECRGGRLFAVYEPAERLTMRVVLFRP